ncbi:hypothetical protein M011DRAFT_478427 [Sporormia fimetaria CBS 119925]|uniref:2EXR domain-containing protein n=1 Tax=Sporormia fimetaria CBS 119925 TaxID=1340428 RepID=A0A6A6V6B2_9PLEO|nr:hypothetical protein M011DRAFT_478427 [Sporormia fimetaria CBS 119925]
MNRDDYITGREAPPEVEWASSQKADPSKASFLDLPRELRDMIYELALVVPGAIFFYACESYPRAHIHKAVIVRHKDLGPSSPLPVHQALQSKLLRVSRQLHAEATPMLYSRNLFRLFSSNVNFAPRYRGYVHNILFPLDSVSNKLFSRDVTVVAYWWRQCFWPEVLFQARMLLKIYPNLRSLTFSIKEYGNMVTWRPAFVPWGLRGGEVRERREIRVKAARAWLRDKCPMDDGVKRVLRMEIMGGERNGNGGEESEFDVVEFAEAFDGLRAAE